MYIGPNKAKERKPVRKAKGITPSETYLGGLCGKAFLSLWSYPGLYRDQCKHGDGDGKELCDLLVVFDNHVLIFSDKHCDFPSTGNLSVDWRRWFKRAVQNSAEQARGAERWIKQYPERVFLDRKCKKQFPVQIPSPEAAKFHLIVVAHGCEERCKAELRGSGSLMLMSSSRNSDAALIPDLGPFTVGDLDPRRTFVHVFTKTTLDAVLGALDTAPDFIEYLENKVALLRSGTAVCAPGEEDLLASYVNHTTAGGRHGFTFPSDLDGIMIEEGAWEAYYQSHKFAEIAAFLKSSYAWDNLINRFSRHAMDATQYFTNHTELSNTEIALRFMAREPRIARKHLVESTKDLLFDTPDGMRRTKVIGSGSNGGALYIFLSLPQTSFPSYEEYRQARSDMLAACCIIGKHRFPEVVDFVGIAFAPAHHKCETSEDLLYLDAREWTEEQEADAIRLQREHNLLTSPTMQHPSLTAPQAVLNSIHRRSVSPPKVGRNDRCPCGSGKKFKKCCGMG